MEESYGIYTTVGQRLAGDLEDESTAGLAERLDESTASLFIRTIGQVVYLGTAINVQKEGRRPDTFIYIERTGWHGSLPPRIDLSYIHGFYERVTERLSEIDYGVRDLASDTAFIGDRRERFVSGLSGTDVVEYALGKTLLCREVICVSADLSKSVDFVVAITEKLSPYLYAGFTIVVSKRNFRGADILVTERTASKADISLDTESIADFENADIYRTAGMLPQRPEMAHWAAGRRTRRQIAEKLLDSLKRHMKATGRRDSYLRSFIESEEIEKFRCGEESYGQTLAAKVSAQVNERRPSPSESDYGKWEVSEYDQMRLKDDYNRLMDKRKKKKLWILAAVALIFVLGVGVVLIAGPAGVLSGGGQTPISTPHITPSATIAPPEGNITIEKLSASPGNIPSNLMGVSSAYNITPDSPRTVLIELSEAYDPLLPYYLMKFNIGTFSWDYVTGTSEYSEDGARVEIAEPGIYRIFTERDGGAADTNITGGE